MIITARADRDLRGFPIAVRERILSKLTFYASFENPLVFARKLHGNLLGHYRFRVGEYRAVFDLIEGEVCILAIEHRKDAY